MAKTTMAADGVAMDVPIDCVVSSWGEWTECSEPCGKGYQSHSRTIFTNVEYGGAECPALDEQRDCEMDPCDCEYTDWDKWSSCTVTCGGGTIKRTREIARAASEGGICAGFTEETAICQDLPCPTPSQTSSPTSSTTSSPTPSPPAPSLTPSPTTPSPTLPNATLSPTPLPTSRLHNRLQSSCPLT